MVCAGTGTGVGQRENGFDDMDEPEPETFDIIDAPELRVSLEDCLGFRRKGTDGKRKVGKTLGGASSELLRRKDMAARMCAVNLGLYVKRNSR